jgi:hypothetical protein
VDPSNKEDIAYQLLHIHSRNKKEYLQPILQLISGKKISIDSDKLNSKIEQLKSNYTSEPDDKRRTLLFENLRTRILNFFKDKDTTLYVICQLSPENLLQPVAKNSNIKQLDTLQCLMANITEKLEIGYLDDDPNKLIEKNITIPISIEYIKDNKGRHQKISEIREQRDKEILYNLISDNTFADFGITVPRPIELTQSLTNRTATLLNAEYLNDKLKDINKKLKDV